MTAKEFIKENYTVTNGGEDYICNHSSQLVGTEDIAEEYHQAKLKLLCITDVSVSVCECTIHDPFYCMPERCSRCNKPYNTDKQIAP